MRGKRAKQYRKLMEQYGIAFGFREPYQVLIDAEMMHATAAFKMDLVAGLERTLQGEIKPMITQCCMRHLYTAEPKVPHLVEVAKGFERRRCDHHTLEEPLDTLECLSSVVDAKGSGTNKHRYVVASQLPKVRAKMRTVPGVPLIYVKRSVMIMEPMAGATEQKMDTEEQEKFRAGIKGKRNLTTTMATGSNIVGGESLGLAREEPATKKRKRKVKGPNPLSVKKSKRREPDASAAPVEKTEQAMKPLEGSGQENVVDATPQDGTEVSGKRKRKRKHKRVDIEARIQDT